MATLMGFCTSHIKREPNQVKCLWSLEDPNVLLVNNSEISLAMIGNSVKRIMDAAVGLMDTSLLCGLRYVDVCARLPLSTIQDNIREDEVGFSFLSFPAISWMSLQLRDQLIRDPLMQNKFIVASDESMQMNEEACKQYVNQVSAFLELLLTLIHLTSGNPARATELATLQWRNTGTQMRSIFIHQGHVMLMPTYNKTAPLLQRDRPIARFLPQSVGQLMVVYLVVVLPFSRFKFW